VSTHDEDRPRFMQREQGLASSHATLDFAQDVHERVVFRLFGFEDDDDAESDVLLFSVMAGEGISWAAEG
jgi:hypothetical protein